MAVHKSVVQSIKSYRYDLAVADNVKINHQNGENVILVILTLA